MNKNLFFPIENSNGLQASLQLCTTTIQSIKGWTHERKRICLMMEYLHENGNGSQGFPMMLDAEQASSLIIQLKQMLKAMKMNGNEKLEPVF